MDFGRKAFLIKECSRVGIFGLFVPSTFMFTVTFKYLHKHKIGLSVKKEKGML